MRIRIRTTNRWRRWTERLLLLVAVVAIGAWAWFNIRGMVSQRWADWAFERNLHNQAATGKPPSSQPPAPVQPQVIPHGAVVGRLVIARLGLKAMVREGADAGTLGIALGHIPGTALPGQPGNIGVAGHRDTLFRSLSGIDKNDLIEFQTLNGNYAYRVEDAVIVKPRDVGVLAPGKYPEITLVTCYPFNYIGAAPDRFIVKARLVSGVAPTDPSQPQAAVTPKPPAPKPLVAAAKPPRKPNLTPRDPSVRTIRFTLNGGQSRELADGFLFGVSRADAARQRVNGWMWVTADRRTIWLRGQAAHEPVIFYGHEDGKRRELTITKVAGNSVSGYLTLYGQAPAKTSTRLETAANRD